MKFRCILAGLSVLSMSLPVQAEEVASYQNWQFSLNGGISSDLSAKILPPPLALQGTWRSPFLDRRLAFFVRSRLFFFEWEPPALMYLEFGPRYYFYESEPVDIYGELGLGAVGSSNSRFVLPNTSSSVNAGYTWGYTITPNMGLDIALLDHLDLNIQGGVATHFAGAYVYGAAGLAANF